MVTTSVCAHYRTNQAAGKYPTFPMTDDLDEAGLFLDDGRLHDDGSLLEDRDGVDQSEQAIERSPIHHHWRGFNLDNRERPTDKEGVDKEEGDIPRIIHSTSSLRIQDSPLPSGLGLPYDRLGSTGEEGECDTNSPRGVKNTVGNRRDHNQVNTSRT